MKKIVLVMVAVVLCVAFAAGCTAQTATPSESAQATESAEATESASVEASAEAPAANADYASWTSEEWAAASDGDLTAAAEALLLDIGDFLMDGYSDLVEQAKTNDSVKEQIDSQIESLKSQIKTFLDSTPGATIGDLAEASKQVVNSGAE